MKPPRYVICTLYYDNHSQLVVGHNVRIDHGRVVGSDDESLTIEIGDATLHSKKKRRNGKASRPNKDPQRAAALRRLTSYVPQRKAKA